jgi:hypothetical protein
MRAAATAAIGSSRCARIKEFLFDWLGFVLSTSTINQCVHEAGRAVAPVVDAEIQAAVRDAELLYADKTSWKEHGRLVWLWVFTCATATFFLVGKRSIEVVRQVLGETFRGWLMSDGFWAYRELDQRLRCLAHLIGNAQALEDGLDREAQRVGTHVLTVIATVMAAVYDARGAPPPAGGLRARVAQRLGHLLGGPRPSRAAVDQQRGRACLASLGSPVASAWARAPRRVPAPWPTWPVSSTPAVSAASRPGRTSPRSSASAAKASLQAAPLPSPAR